jgi:hypothetical protein
LVQLLQDLRVIGLQVPLVTEDFMGGGEHTVPTGAPVEHLNAPLHALHNGVIEGRPLICLIQIHARVVLVVVVLLVLLLVLLLLLVLGLAEVVRMVRVVVAKGGLPQGNGSGSRGRVSGLLVWRVSCKEEVGGGGGPGHKVSVGVDEVRVVVGGGSVVGKR